MDTNIFILIVRCFQVMKSPFKLNKILFIYIFIQIMNTSKKDYYTILELNRDSSIENINL